ncbi:MAG: sensor histidine kinase [Devosia sp.]
MTPRSLRLRLLAGAALWIALALFVAGIGIAYMFIASVERDQRRDLTATFNRVVALIDPAASPPGLSQPLTDPRYETPFSGLYWQLEDITTGEAGRSRSLWDFAIGSAALPAAAGATQFATLSGPSGQSLSVLVRDIRLTEEAGNRALRVTIAEDRATLDATIARFGWELAAALLLLAAALIAAAWLQVHLGLSQLQKLRAGIEAIRRGQSDRLEGDFPAEVLPLTAEVNELLQSQQATIDFARARAADLAHGLKTPLAVLATTADALRTRSDPETAALVEQLASEMADRVDYQLRLSRLRMRTRAHMLSARLDEALRRTVAVLRKTHDGERLNWVAELGQPLAVDIDDHDLIELVGVLLENAAKWAQSAVHLRSRRDGGMAEVSISDDGPGLTEAQIAGLGTRGRKLDESKKGSGLGVSIALEIVALNNGTLDFGRSERGGLLITLRLPLAAR